MATSRPGMYVAGLSESPKDIPETIVQASAAACMAAQCRRIQKRPPRRKGLAAERDVSGDAPRIGVFVCDCGFNIGGVLDVAPLVAHAARFPEVVVAEMTGHGCSSEALERFSS